MEKIRVYNRSVSAVGYRDDESNKSRFWDAIKNGVCSYRDLTLDEIERLANSEGGKRLLQDNLLIMDKDLCEELNLDVSDEYFYDIEMIKKILFDGTEEELSNLIDVAPESINDIIKQLAVELELDSTKKRQIIKEKLKFNVGFAIENNIGFASSVTKK